MNLNELKADYSRTLDALMWYLQSNVENTDLTEQEIFGYKMCMEDVKKYFKDSLEVTL